MGSRRISARGVKPFRARKQSRFIPSRHHPALPLARPALRVMATYSGARGRFRPIPAYPGARKGEREGPMKATIERAKLLRCLSHVQSVVERRNTIPILSNVLIEASADGLRQGHGDRPRPAGRRKPRCGLG